MRWRIGSVTRGWAVTFAGSALQFGPNFVTSVIVSRVFGPTDYGIYAMLAGIRSIGGVVVDAGLTNAATKQVAAAWPREPDVAQQRARVFLWLRMGLALLGTGIGVALIPLLARFVVPDSRSAPLLVLTLLGMVVAALQSVALTLLYATQHFTRASLVMVTGATLSMLCIMGLALAGQLSLFTALIWAGIVVSLGTALLAYRLLPLPGAPRRQMLWRPPARSQLRRDGLPMLRFGGWIWVSTILTTLLSYLDLFWLNYWSTPVVVGVYARALNLATRVSTVNGSLYPVLLPTASSLDSRAAIVRYLRQGLLRSAAVGGILLLLLVPLSGWFIPLLYGPEYAPAVPIFHWMVGLVIFDLLAMPAVLLVYPANRPELSAAASAVQLALFLLLGSWLIPSYGAMGAVGAKFGARVAHVALLLTLLARHYRYRMATEEAV
jgi:O-antigen/teichoic acid export membrane protein